MEQIASFLQNTLSPDETTRKSAEAQLTKLRESPQERPQLHNFLFQIIRTKEIPSGLRHAAAIFLQNGIKNQWDPESDTPLAPQEKEQLKPALLETIFCAEQKIRDALTFSITKIAEHDFPMQWQDAMPFVKSKLDNHDPQTNQVAFEVIIALLSKYELHSGLTPENVPELIKVNQLVANAVLAGVENAAQGQSFHIAKLGTNVFCHLCQFDFSTEVEESLTRWMKCFYSFLQYPENEQTRPLKAAAIEAIYLFLRRYSEEFTPYMEHFTPIVWKLLCDTSDTSDDQIKIAGLEYLTTLARSCFWQTLSSEETLRTLCEQVIVPNVFARSYEIEQIEEDYAEYIRTDIEGNNADTRRRSACNLALALMSNKLEETGRPLIVNAIHTLLQKGLSNLARHWLEMDAALCLILSLSTGNEQKSLNNTFVQDSLCDLEAVYRQFVFPELSTAGMNHIVLKADALKFVCHFRYSLPTQALADVLTLLSQWISHNNCVLAIYAAHCVDQIFMMNHISMKHFIPAEKITPLASAALDGLHKHEAAELDRVAKALYRITRVYGSDLQPINTRVLQFVSAKLQQALQVEPNCTYMHYLIDSLGSILSPQTVEEISTSVFQLSITVLSQNTEFLVPYVLQLLAGCIRASSGAYESPASVLGPILGSSFYSDKRYVHAITVFTVTAFKFYCIDQTRAYLPEALSYFDHLIAIKPLDHEGFFLISAFLECLPVELLRETLPRILQSLFRRLSNAKTNKFIKNLVIWLSRCVLALEKHDEGGSLILFQQIDGMQSGLLEMLLRNVWMPWLERCVNRDDRALVITAMTAMLVSGPHITANQALWAAMAAALCTLIQNHQKAGHKPHAFEKSNEETIAVGSRTLASCKYNLVVYAHAEPCDLFPERCRSLLRNHDGTFGPLLRSLPDQYRQFLGFQ